VDAFSRRRAHGNEVVVRLGKLLGMAMSLISMGEMTAVSITHLFFRQWGGFSPYRQCCPILYQLDWPFGARLFWDSR
jgi:hypothetical protein